MRLVFVRCSLFERELSLWQWSRAVARGSDSDHRTARRHGVCESTRSLRSQLPRAVRVRNWIAPCPILDCRGSPARAVGRVCSEQNAHVKSALSFETRPYHCHIGVRRRCGDPQSRSIRSFSPRHIYQGLQPAECRSSSTARQVAQSVPPRHRRDAQLQFDGTSS